MNFIRNNLAVCGFGDIGKRETFDAHGFDAQLQCAEPFDDWLPECVEVKALPFDDGALIPEQLFRDALDWACTHWGSNSKILISCAGGQSRSVTMAISLIYANSDRSFMECVVEVMDKVSGAYPHPLVLACAAKFSDDPLEFESLKSLYDSVKNPPPYPWKSGLINDAVTTLGT